MSRGGRSGADGSRARARVTAIVLAAGASRRMGRPKQLLLFRGRPLLQHAIDAAAGAGDAGVEEILVVLGHEAEAIERAIALPPNARVVRNPDHASGQGSSLRAGLGAAPPGSAAAVILLSDQPQVGAAAVRRVVEAWRGAATPVVRSSYGGAPSPTSAGERREEGVPGHPVVLGREVWGEIVAPSSDANHPGATDQGARGLLDRHPEWVNAVPFPGPAPIEVDTPEDYLRLLESGAE